MKERYTCGLLAMLLISSQVYAQDNDVIIAVSYFQCDSFEQIGPWMQQIDSLGVPVYQELVNEGKLYGFGTLIHDWADYENVILWRSGPDVASILSAQQELGRRTQERYPDAENVGCSNHRDAFYWLGPNTGPPTDDAFRTEVVSYYRCDFDKMGDIASSVDSLWLPIARDMVEEGLYGSWGMMGHAWAGYENIIFFRTTKDQPSFFTAQEEFGRRLEEMHPDSDALHGCSAHRDAFYGVGPHTSAPE